VKKLVLTLLCSFAMISPALAMDKPTRAQLAAFIRAGGTDIYACRVMMNSLRTVDDANYSTETNYTAVAASAKVCLGNLRNRGASSDAQYPPRYALVTSCSVLNHLDDSIVACDGVPDDQ
jgi:hypothetical protein